jgi:hypothetical protein
MAKSTVDINKIYDIINLHLTLLQAALFFVVVVVGAWVVGIAFSF